MTDAEAARRFRALVDMSPAAIRAWSRDERAKLASLPATRRRLPRLAGLRAKPPARWEATDYAFARRVVGFIARFEGMRRQHGCTTKISVALRNWGRASCPAPPKRR